MTPTSQQTPEAPTPQKAEERYGILAQGEEASKPPSPTAAPAGAAGSRRILLAAGAGLGVLLLAGGAWLLWPRQNQLQPTAQAKALTANAGNGQISLNRILQPTFTPTPSGAERAAGGAAPIQIVVVTPTPNPNQRVSVGGKLVDRPLAVAGSEPGQLGVLGSADLLTLASLNNAGAESAPQDASAAVAAPTAQPTFDTSSIVVPPLVEEVINAPIPQVQVIPIPGLAAAASTAPAEVAPLVQQAAASVPDVTAPMRQWSSFDPAPPEQNDHFWVDHAYVTADFNQMASPSYQFGSTGGGNYRPHHGLDVANVTGTPVRAAAAGEVVHAGMDDPVILGPYPNFYGNAVVIRLDQQLTVAGGQLDAFLLYGHLSQVNVQKGQHVQVGDIVGAVGMTGIAIGPHLHVEMRLGSNDYEHSVNPYLWVKPMPGNGAVAVRLLTADGRSWPGQRLTLARFENGQAVWGRLIETYLDNENLGPDPAWGENGAMGDVPAGYYVLIGNVNGEAVRAEFFVRDGQTTFVEVRTKQ